MSNQLCVVLAYLAVLSGLAAQAYPEEAISAPPYKRADWDSDQKWDFTGETGKNGCRWDIRHLMLRDAGRKYPETLVTREEAGFSCRVIALTLEDPYTGEVTTLPAKKVHVDHVVALGEAHRSGGWQWSASQRQRFYNDPDNLVLTASGINSAKSDVDPGGDSYRRRSTGWWPPNAEAHCWYATLWLSVKAEWELSLDPREVAALIEVTRGCWTEP